MEPALAAPGPPWLAASAALALGSTWLTRRAASVPALRNWHRWLHPFVVLAWLATLWVVSMRLLSAATLPELAARGLILATILAALIPVLRDLLAGVAIAVEGRVGLGQKVVIAGYEGKVVHLGLRSVVIRADDRTERVFSNRRIGEVDVIRHDGAREDAPCSWEIQVPAHLPLPIATTQLEQAILLSPYLAPGKRPEIFLLRFEAGVAFMRVRTHVFDVHYSDAFHGDVLARLHGSTMTP